MAKKRAKAGVRYGMRKLNEGITTANQWQGTAQQEKFIVYYMDPKSPHFARGYDAAIAAGYSESYARNIANPSNNRQWIAETRFLVKMGPEHIMAALQDEAMNHKENRGGDRIRALEILAKMNNMLIEKKVVAHTNIEQALNELE